MQFEKLKINRFISLTKTEIAKGKNALLNMPKYIFLLIFAISILTINAQSDSTFNHFKWHKNNISFTAAYINGTVAPTNIFVKGINENSILINSFKALNLKLSTQTTGETEQEVIFNYPLWGLGFKVLDFENINEIGIPLALYGFVDIPFIRKQRFTLNGELGFGLSFNWHSFNPITNKFNVALGLGQAFMSDAGLSLNYALSENIDLIAGVNFTHFSNGSIKMPNFGINSYAPKLGLKYNFYNRPEFIKTNISKFKPHGEWNISAFAAMKNIIFDSVSIEIKEKYEGVFFPVYGISALYNWQLSHFSKIGIGATFNFNESINAQVTVENNELIDIDGPITDNLQLSIYPSYEICIDKISIVLQPSFYIYRKTFKNISPVFHQRIGINYHINDNFYAGITLRDYSMHADFVEWTLGYVISKK